VTAQQQPLAVVFPHLAEGHAELLTDLLHTTAAASWQTAKEMLAS
jgi:hypothetical protein